ncbi:hypothetical protein BC830DRAFT_529005 [Chytriomyces sp. MP71]|nr:hypothetical protein BC830DRAFT_529005 [Chytriomyces sp. MP71]
MSSQGANAPAANRLGLRIAVPTPSQRAATVAAVAPLLTSSSSSTSISSVTAFTGTTPSSTAKRSSKNMLVHTWSQELVLAWLNQTLLPLLASAATPTTATVSASASASTARKSNKKGNDMELLDSVFNIADLSYLATPTSPASATPVLSLRDLKRAGIKNGKDLLGLNVASVKALLPYISPDERTIVLDAIEELKLMVLEATGDLKLAFGLHWGRISVLCSLFRRAICIQESGSLNFDSASLRAYHPDRNPCRADHVFG